MSKVRSKHPIAINGARKEHRDASLIFIACEGEQTERQYFSFNCLKNSRVKLIIIPSDGKSAPSYVLDNLKARTKSYSLNVSDQMWIVSDIDKWNYETQLKPLFGKKIKTIPVQLALSNPCFEVFLYLHFFDMPAEPFIDAHHVERVLRKKLGSYSKTKLDEKIYEPLIWHAITESQKTTYSTFRLPNNPGTDVGKLIESIYAMKPHKE